MQILRNNDVKNVILDAVWGRKNGTVKGILFKFIK